MSTDLLTAVSFDPHRKIAGIAITFRGGRLVCADIVEADDLFCAQILAILREIEITSRDFSHRACIITDSELLLPCLRGHEWPPTESSELLLRDLRRALEIAGDKVELGYTPRANTKPAFTAARQTRKAWLAGRKGGTTWSKTSLLDSAEAAA